MSEPSQQRALITGANRGIGFETARQLAARGVDVVMTGRDEASLQAAAQAIQGSQVEIAVLDVTNVEDVHRIRADFGDSVNLLINNAGILLEDDGMPLENSESVFHRTMEVNFYGPLRLCRAFLPAMRQRGWGRVVNVSSGYGSISNMNADGPSAYKISKAALNAMTRILADEVSDHNIKVNAVDPGWVQTRMGGESAPRSPSDAARGIVWAVTLDDDGPSGGFFHDGESQDW